MSAKVSGLIDDARGVLRHEPLAKRVRAEVDGVTVLDTTGAVLVWEPRRLLCEYAVPTADLVGQLTDAQPTGDVPEVPADGLIFPNVPFAAHSSEGKSFDVRIGDRILESAAFAPDDPDLAGLVVLDFDAFDAWFQEDERNIGHPRDPMHRIDTFPTSRRIRVERAGTVVADTTQAWALFEAGLPPRYYLPRSDVQVDLTPTETSTVCAYKGWASYWSAEVDGETLADVAWSYEDPLPDSQLIRSLVCFDGSQVDVTVDPA